jgi:Zn-dependent M28 family amino/carboxypeptidase
MLPSIELPVAHDYQYDTRISRFDMMGKRLYKTYNDLTNIVIRVSDGTPESKKHAVLVNSHLDSTLPSPGAADDALAVGIMLECLRVLMHTPGWTPSYAIVFRELWPYPSFSSPAEQAQCSIMQKSRFRTRLICSLHNIR